MKKTITEAELVLEELRHQAKKGRYDGCALALRDALVEYTWAIWVSDCTAEPLSELERELLYFKRFQPRVASCWPPFPNDPDDIGRPAFALYLTRWFIEESTPLAESGAAGPGTSVAPCAAALHESQVVPYGPVAATPTDTCGDPIAQTASAAEPSAAARSARAALRSLAELGNRASDLKDTDDEAKWVGQFFSDVFDPLHAYVMKALRRKTTPSEKDVQDAMTSDQLSAPAPTHQVQSSDRRPEVEQQSDRPLDSGAKILKINRVLGDVHFFGKPLKLANQEVLLLGALAADGGQTIEHDDLLAVMSRNRDTVDQTALTTAVKNIRAVLGPILEALPAEQRATLEQRLPLAPRKKPSKERAKPRPLAARLLASTHATGYVLHLDRNLDIEVV